MLEPYVMLDEGQRPIRRSPATRSYKRAFHDALRHSILTEGIRNPVNVWDVDGRYFLRYGQSRVEAAWDLALNTVPAIVSGPDASRAGLIPADRMIDLHSGPDALLGLFADPPQQWRIHPDGYLDFYKCLGHFDAELRELGIWRPQARTP
jgi:hypothetical protein